MSRYLTPTLIGGLLAAGLLATLLVAVWPPTFAVAGLIAMLALMLTTALGVHLAARRRHRQVWGEDTDATAGMSSAELAAWRLRVLTEREQRLELRELQIARQTRALQVANEDYLDILEAEPPAEELAALVDTDRKLLALIETESQRAFERVLDNRYAADEGVNTGLILEDVRDFVEQVARLYRPDTEHPLFETEIERIAKSLSSTALHLLVVVDDLPINLKSYNTATMYRLIRRGASYYGTYKTFRPYIEHGLNVLQAARLALGVNPAAVGAAWAAGKLTTHGAKAIGERVLQRRALQLLNDFVRVIGFEAAMMYGGDFRHRDANWALAALLVNLEVARGADAAGRDAALFKLCNLALRHEFDRVRLLNHLAKHRAVDVAKVRPQIIMTRREREDAAAVLAEHCRKTRVDLNDAVIRRWRTAAESVLDVGLDLPGDAARPPAAKRGRVRRLLDRVRGAEDG